MKCTAAYPRVSGRSDSLSTPPHCVGAMGSTHFTSCNTLPHFLGAVGRRTRAHGGRSSLGPERKGRGEPPSTDLYGSGSNSSSSSSRANASSSTSASSSSSALSTTSDYVPSDCMSDGLAGSQDRKRPSQTSVLAPRMSARGHAMSGKMIPMLEPPPLPSPLSLSLYMSVVCDKGKGHYLWASRYWNNVFCMHGD